MSATTAVDTSVWLGLGVACMSLGLWIGFWISERAIDNFIVYRQRKLFGASLAYPHRQSRLLSLELWLLFLQRPFHSVRLGRLTVLRGYAPESQVAAGGASFENEMKAKTRRGFLVRWLLLLRKVIGSIRSFFSPNRQSVARR